MADLVVRADLDDLVRELDFLVGEFQGAVKLEDSSDGAWGQPNANSTMGDFADNWTVHRDAMVDDMKKLRDAVREVCEQWAQTDTELAASLEAADA